MMRADARKGEALAVARASSLVAASYKEILTYLGLLIHCFRQAREQS